MMYDKISKLHRICVGFRSLNLLFKKTYRLPICIEALAYNFILHVLLF